MGEGFHGPTERGSGPGRDRMAARQAAPGQQVRRGPAGTSAVRSLLTHRHPVPDPPCPPGVASSGALGFSPAGWPQRRPFSSISQPRPQLHPLPGRMQGARDAGLEAPSPSPLPPPPRIPGAAGAGGAEAQSPSCGGRRPLHRHPGLAPRLPSHPHHLAGLLVRWGRLRPVLRAPLCRQRRTTGRGAGGLGRNEKSGGANSTRRPKGSWSQRDAPWHGRVGFLPALRPPAFPALEPARLSGLQLNTFSPKLALSNFVL